MRVNVAYGGRVWLNVRAQPKFPNYVSYPSERPCHSVQWTLIAYFGLNSVLVLGVCGQDLKGSMVRWLCHIDTKIGSRETQCFGELIIFSRKSMGEGRVRMGTKLIAERDLGFREVKLLNPSHTASRVWDWD